MITTERSSRQHILELSVLRSLKRDTKLDNLVTYFYDDLDSSGDPVWILALVSKDGNAFMELGRLDRGEGTRNVTREIYRQWVKDLTEPRTADQIKRHMYEVRKKKASEDRDQNQKYSEAVTAIYKDVRARRGHVAAERYLHNTGMRLTDAEIQIGT